MQSNVLNDLGLSWWPCFLLKYCACPPTQNKKQHDKRQVPVHGLIHARDDNIVSSRHGMAAEIHVLNWGGPPLGFQILYTFPTPKMGIKQIEEFSDIILRICGFLRSRLESQSWNSFNPFPIVNGVSAGVPTPPDSARLRS